MPSPRDMDPKFKDAEPKEMVSEETPMIVHRQQYIDNDGVTQTKEHRVPVHEWSQYEKENNL